MLTKSITRLTFTALLTLMLVLGSLLAFDITSPSVAHAASGIDSVNSQSLVRTHADDDGEEPSGLGSAEGVVRAGFIALPILLIGGVSFGGWLYRRQSRRQD